MIERFVRRLEKIGITVELVGNYPWVYLDSVNGRRVTERYRANHGYTAFFMPVTNNQVTRFSDRRVVFSKIRSMINE